MLFWLPEQRNLRCFIWGENPLGLNLSCNVQTGSRTQSVCPAGVHPTLAESFHTFFVRFCPSPQPLCHSEFLHTCYVQGVTPDSFITFSSQPPRPRGEGVLSTLQCRADSGRSCRRPGSNSCKVAAGFELRTKIWVASLTPTPRVFKWGP